MQLYTKLIIEKSDHYFSKNITKNSDLLSYFNDLSLQF